MIEPLAFALAELAPRNLLTFGLTKGWRGPDGCLVYPVDPNAAAGDVADMTLRDFVARKIGEPGARRPSSFDLAILRGYTPDAIARIRGALAEIAHARSALLVIDPLGDPGSDALPIDGAAPAAWLLGIAAGRPAPLADWIARHRTEPLRVSAAIRPVTDAPHWPGGEVQPRYHDIAGIGAAVDSQPAEEWPTGDGRAIGDWWGKPLALLSPGVVEARRVGVLDADGKAWTALFGSDGGLLPASLAPLGGYGPSGTPASIWKQPTAVFDGSGTRYPLADAAALLADAPLVPGDFLFLDKMDKRFGHFLLESLSRAWALDWALARDMRVLVFGKLAPHVRAALRLLGIGDDRLVTLRNDTVYERVFFPDPAHRLYGSVSPAAAGPWRRMAAAALAEVPPPADPPRLLYLSRAGAPGRTLTNEAELEGAIIARGGQVVRPETLGFAEQVALVARAPAIVGCFGSQLHLSMFAAAGTPKLVIGNDRFTAPEETLISIANGTIVDHYIERVAKAGRMRTADWTVDLSRFLPAFDRWLAALPTRRIGSPADGTANRTDGSPPD